MIIFENISYEIYITIIIIAFIFWFLSNISLNYLVVIIITIILIYFLYYYLQQLSDIKISSNEYKNIQLDKDIQDRRETNDENFFIDIFPKHIKYLKKNEKLVDIITNLRFITKFNKSIFSDIILKMNKLMKVYIYILSNRYDIVEYIPIFTDIRDSIIEIMYSLILIIPDKIKHIYGINTYDEIYNSTYNFISYSRNMLEILENYGKIHKQLQYIPDNYFKPYNALSKSYFP